MEFVLGIDIGGTNLVAGCVAADGSRLVGLLSEPTAPERGADDVMVFRAKCCNPIRGERIVGYITRGKGVSVHSLGCPNVLNLMFDPERRIEVEWDSAGTDQAPYVVRLTMQVEDRKGMLAEISAKISDINTNITNMEARTGEDQQARIDMTVEIRDMKHLEKVIKSIKGVQGVLGVERTARA